MFDLGTRVFCLVDSEGFLAPVFKKVGCDGGLNNDAWRLHHGEFVPKS